MKRNAWNDALERKWFSETISDPGLFDWYRNTIVTGSSEAHWMDRLEKAISNEIGEKPNAKNRTMKR